MATLLYSPTGKPTTAPINVSRTIQTFPLGAMRLIGLHGGENATSVGANNTALADTVEDAALKGRGVRWFRVTGKQAGSVMFEARSPGGVLDYLQIRFVTGSTVATKAVSFGIPKGESRKGCQFTQAGHFWRLEIPKNGRAIVGLRGGASLRIGSNNTSVADTGMEVVHAEWRKLPIVGVRQGDAMIEARDAGGKVQAFFQVHVGPEQKEYGLLSEGHEAGKRVAEVLQSTWTRPEPGPYNGKFGAMTLKRGTRWDGNRMIVYWDHQYVLYLVGSQLWKVKTGDFYNDIFYKALGRAGQSAKGWVTVSEVLMSTVTGFLVGPTVIVASQIIVLTMCIGAHSTEAGKAMDALPKAAAGLAEIRRRYPTLWVKLRNRVGLHMLAVFPDALLATAKDPKNIAFFLGRLLRGTGVAEIVEQTGEKFATMSLKVFAKVFAKTAVIVQALHLAPSTAHVSLEHVRHAMTQYGGPDTALTLSEQEARTILDELRRHADSATQMQKTESALSEVLRFADVIERDLRSTKR